MHQTMYSRDGLFDIVCWSISAAGLGTIISTYAHISSGRLTDWSTLLKLANVLGMVACAALIVPSTEALSPAQAELVSWLVQSNVGFWDL
jgi:hypothetical protein